MERLSPVERAVFVLREAFEYPFRDIAEALGLSEANARQLAFRARRHLAGHRHHPVDPAERDRLREAFLDAARAGDLTGLMHLLAEGMAGAARGGCSADCPDRARGASWGQTELITVWLS
jgi:RNA polymerase sigma-70 factor (ECF subfamily)